MNESRQINVVSHVTSELRGDCHTQSITDLFHKATQHWCVRCTEHVRHVVRLSQVDFFRWLWNLQAIHPSINKHSLSDSHS